MIHFLSIILVLSVIVSDAAEAAERALEVYYTADSHGYFDPCPG